MIADPGDRLVCFLANYARQGQGSLNRPELPRSDFCCIEVEGAGIHAFSSV